MTEENDRVEDEKHIRSAMKTFGYPEWSFRKVEHQRRVKKSKQSEKPSNVERTSRKHLAVIPYVQGVSDPLERIFRKHNIATAVKPHQTLRQTLVHPKDKKTLNEQSGIVYKIPCKDCDQVYIGETGRPFSVRKREHLKDVQDFEKLPYTRSSRKQSHNEQNKSAITDHVASTNHSIDWDSSTAVAREDNRLRRWIRESIYIQMEAGNTMNRDRGQYQLTRSY